MAQSRSRRKPRIAAATASKRAARILGMEQWELIVVAVFSLAVIAGVWSWRSWDQTDAAFKNSAAEGRATLATVETFPSEGNKHVPEGTPVNYRTDPPTSGAHYPTPTLPGLYVTPQLPGNLVHAMEHGNIVIYYDRPTPAVMQELKDWAGHFTNPWEGVIVTPKPGLGSEVIFTAWTKMLRFAAFDKAAAAAFIDRFRGRGPERPR